MQNQYKYERNILTYGRYIEGCKFAPGCKNTPDAKIHPGANVAHEHGLRELALMDKFLYEPFKQQT